MINAAHDEARLILEKHQNAMERMVESLLEKETVDRHEVAEVFSDVPKWEHTSEGALRIKYPDHPVLPQPLEDDQIAAAEETEEEEEPVTESLTLNRKLRRSSRPADAGA